VGVGGEHSVCEDKNIFIAVFHQKTFTISRGVQML
jgi:hypothetical protein